MIQAFHPATGRRAEFSPRAWELLPANKDGWQIEAPAEVLQHLGGTGAERCGTGVESGGTQVEVSGTQMETGGTDAEQTRNSGGTEVETDGNHVELSGNDAEEKGTAMESKGQREAHKAPSKADATAAEQPKGNAGKKQKNG